jgi:hypothetical protein
MGLGLFAVAFVGFSRPAKWIPRSGSSTRRGSAASSSVMTIPRSRAKIGEYVP